MGYSDCLYKISSQNSKLVYSFWITSFKPRQGPWTIHFIVLALTYNVRFSNFWTWLKKDSKGTNNTIVLYK